MAEDPITGLVLAGGAARRLQAAHPGADKGLLPLAGRPLIAWAIDNLAPQVQSLVISANRHLDDYRQLGHPVLPDRLPDMPGPLAGIHAALTTRPYPTAAPSGWPWPPATPLSCPPTGLPGCSTHSPAAAPPSPTPTTLSSPIRWWPYCIAACCPHWMPS